MTEWKENQEARERRREFADRFGMPFKPGPVGMPSSRNTTDGCLRLDIRQISRAGWLDGKSHLLPNDVSVQYDGAGVNVVFLYDRSFMGHYERVQQTLPLDWTACHYGSYRLWFRCPNCNRRQAVLYVPVRCPVASGYEAVFSCRKCWGLLYPSQYVYPRPAPKWARAE